jgi:hypothetical protein
MAGRRSNRRRKKEKNREEIRKIKAYLDGLDRGIKKRKKRLSEEVHLHVSDTLHLEIKKLNFKKGQHQERLNRLAV